MKEEDYEQVRRRIDMIVLSNCPICHSNFAEAPVHLWPVEFKEKVTDFCARHIITFTSYLLKETETGEEKIFYHYKNIAGQHCSPQMPTFPNALECARFDYEYAMGEPIEIVCGSTVYSIEELAGQQQWKKKEE